MTPDLQSVRAKWIADRGAYGAVVERVVDILKTECKRSGVFAAVNGRVKETGSLLKKIITKGRPYEELTDKAGARLVVRFREHLKPAEAVVERAFKVVLREDKTEKLGFNQVGYQAVHYDVMLMPETVEPELRDRVCEIQVRTLCQNLWAEMDHQLSYKPGETISRDVSRQIYLLNASLELADRQFSFVNEEIRSEANPSLQLLTALEGYYYHFTARAYDPELAQASIELLLPLYHGEPIPDVLARFTGFIENNSAKFSLIYEEYGAIEDPPLFLYQPELFMVLALLERDSFLLEERWCSKYPREELERMATMWGRPLD